MLLAVEWAEFDAATPAALAHPASPEAAGANAIPDRFTPPPPDRFAVISERPLFVPDRRPQLDANTGASSTKPPDVVVEGVVMTQGRTYAVIQHGNPPKLETVSVGADVDGWTVKDINVERVTFEGATATIAVAVAQPGENPKNQSPARGTPGNVRAHD
jgi:general secretion pathway protein N